MNTEDMIEVMGAHQAGKNIQMRPVNTEDEWTGVHEPSWDWDGYEYRVFIQNIETRYWEFLKDNVWTITKRRYANFEIEEVSDQEEWDKYHSIDALGTRTVEDEREQEEG